VTLVSAVFLSLTNT